MGTTPWNENDWFGQLPLPLAQLYRRAQNAKTPADRHHHAFYLAEATLKLAACLRIGAVLAGDLRPGTPLARSLEQLCLPSFGHWVGFLRDSTAYLRDGARGPLPLLDANDQLLVHRPLPACRAFAERVCQPQAEDDSPPLSPEQVREAARQGILGFFNLMAAYRNQVFGHGAPRLAAFYDEVGPLLLAAVREVLRQEALFGGLTLAVARSGGGAVEVQWQGLRGSAGMMLAAAEVGPDPDPSEAWARAAAGQLFFVAPGVRVPLYPLVLYQEDAHERERVGFLNRTVTRRAAAAGAAEEVRRCEYLDYNTGEHLREVDARQELTALLARLRGQQVSASAVDEVGAAAAAEPQECEEPLQSGGVVGDFELEGELGRGAMGVVYRARQRSLNRHVALKVLLPGLAADPIALARFRREIAALARCEHPNLVKILASGSDGERHYYAMELIEGATLADLSEVLGTWRRGGRSLLASHLAAAVQASSHRNAPDTQRPEATRADAPAEPQEVAPAAPSAAGPALYRHLATLFAEAAEALAHLHERGVLHRDLKPANVMLTADGRRLVLMDLGLAQLRDRSQSLTRSGIGWVGTLRYCAPEQLQSGLLGVDERADIYGMGATLYELATLHPLFDGDTEQRLLAQVLREPPRPPRAAAPDLPRDLSAILMQCLDKDRSGRYANARDLADDLRAFAADRPIRARPVSGWEQTWRWARRNPRVAVLSAALVVVLALLASGSTLAALHINRARVTVQEQKDEIEAKAGQLLLINARLDRERRRAEGNFEEATRQRRAVEKNQRALEQQKKLAQQQKERAVEYFSFARGTVDHFYKRVSQDRLLKAPGMETLRKDLLDRTRRFYEAFIDEQDGPDRLVSQEELAEVLEQLASLTAAIDSRPRAVGLYRQAEKIYLKLDQQQPGKQDFKMHLASIYVELGACLSDLGRSAEAEEVLKKAQAMQKGLVLRRPASGSRVVDEIATYNNLAAHYLQRGELEKGRQAGEEGLKIARRLVAEDPRNPVYQYRLGGIYVTLGALRGMEKKNIASHKLFLQAREHLTRAVALSPELAAGEEFQTALAMMYGNLGHAALLIGETVDAEEALGKAVEVQEKLAKAHPGSLTHTVSLMRVYRNLAFLHILDKSPEKAEKAARKALAVQDSLLPAQRDGDWKLNVELGTLYLQMGTMKLEQARAAEARDWLDQGAQALDRALVKIPGQPNATSQLSTTLGVRASALNRLGRYGDALADCVRARKLDGGKKPSLLMEYATALAGTGDHKAALAEIDRIVGRKAPGDEDRRYTLAQFFAVVFRAVRDDPKLEAGERLRLADDCGGRALYILRTLQENNYFARPPRLRDLKENHCFEALRRTPLFRRLVEKIEEKAADKTDE